MTPAPQTQPAAEKHPAAEHHPAAAAIGTFDGVHRGHEAVIAKLRDVSDERHLTPIAVTFDRHPLDLIAPERAPKAITTTERKARLLKDAGVTPVVLPFDETMRATTALDWMRRLKRDYNVAAIVVGYDNTFGSDGVNLSIADYRRLGQSLGIDIIEAPFVAAVSSSAIRKAVGEGDVKRAAEMLGRPYRLTGTVVDGNRLGRTIGFPTANINPDPTLAIPADGVYAATAILSDGSKHPAMVNIGRRPTVRRGEQRTIEAHVINWKGDLYGSQIGLDFTSRLRDEVRFNSIEALRAQLEKDRLAALH